MLQSATTEASIELVRETSAPTFVINLCASTTPVALSHPQSADLKRYTFFVTRRREEGRERFRLHMGYFETLEQAETLLATIRDVYPAAWAGPAPDSGAPSPRAVAPKAAAAARPVPVAAAPVVVPAPVAASKPAAAIAVAAPAPAPVAPPAAVAAPAVETSAPAAAAPARGVADLDLSETMSNVREVLALLGDEPPPKPVTAAAKKPAAATRPTAAAPKPVTAATAAPAATTPRAAAAKPVAPVLTLAPDPVPVSKPVAARPAAKPAVVEAVAAKAAAPAREPALLTPEQTLRVLEEPATPLAEIASASTANKIRVLTPEDTQTLRDIKLEAQQNAPSSYAVQLVWAVQPIDMQALPHLAIFDAYTLYHVEGNRQGRRWYGLRLGFFSDANAAKQVALYVRSEYNSVAVVPVTAKEKDGARAPTLAAAPAAAQTARAPAAPKAAHIPTVKPLGMEGFELLPDEVPRAAKRDLDDARPADVADEAPKTAVTPKAPRATGKAPGKRAVRRAAPPGAPQPLEETLELLGASTLTLDESREIINDSAIRNARPEKKSSRFGRLLSRLSGEN